MTKGRLCKQCMFLINTLNPEEMIISQKGTKYQSSLPRSFTAIKHQTFLSILAFKDSLLLNINWNTSLIYTSLVLLDFSVQFHCSLLRLFQMQTPQTSLENLFYVFALSSKLQSFYLVLSAQNTKTGCSQSEGIALCILKVKNQRNLNLSLIPVKMEFT